MESDSHFTTFVSNLKKLHYQLHFARSCFDAWEELQIIKAPNYHEEIEAQANVEALNQFCDFFVCTTAALQRTFFLELAKIFDEHKDAISISKLKDCARSQKRHLTSSEFQKYNKDRLFLESLSKNYKGIQEISLKKIERILLDNKTSLEKLRRHRDQFLAHTDPKQIKISITREEVSELFRVAAEILNLLSSEANQEIWVHKKNYCREEIQALVHLIRKSSSRDFTTYEQSPN